MLQNFTFHDSAFATAREKRYLSDEDIEFYKTTFTRELEEYEQHMRMTMGERQALREWVASGNSLYTNPGSRYIPIEYVDPTEEYLTVYRRDREIEDALRVKDATKEQIIDQYISAGKTDEDRQWDEFRHDTPLKVREKIGVLTHKVRSLTRYLEDLHLTDAAKAFVHSEMPELRMAEEKDFFCEYTGNWFLDLPVDIQSIEAGEWDELRRATPLKVREKLCVIVHKIHSITRCLENLHMRENARAFVNIEMLELHPGEENAFFCEHTGNWLLDMSEEEYIAVDRDWKATTCPPLAC